MATAAKAGVVLPRQSRAGPKLSLSKEKAAALPPSEGGGLVAERHRPLTGVAVLEMENWQESTALASEQCRSPRRQRDSICVSPWKVLLRASWRANPRFAQRLLCFSCACSVVPLWALNIGIQQIPGKCYKAALFRCFSPENRKC